MDKTKSIRSNTAQASVKSRKQVLKGSMSVWELILIGIGGIIGAGYFLGSGSPIRTAGPSVLLAFVIGGLITMQAVGALNSLSFDHPSEGAFKTYADMYLGRFMGYMQGWTFYLMSILTISSEAVASAIFVKVWLPHIPLWIMSSSFAALVILINAFGVKNFSTVESFMSVIKIAALFGFIVVASIAIFGGQSHEGTTQALDALHNTGFFPHGFSGLAQSMLIVVFAYAGIGVFATAAVHLKHPKYLDIGGLVTVGTLTGLYLLSIAGLLLLLPWNEVNVQTSPFVQALQHVHLNVLADCLNAVILIASFSVMAGSVFSANQILKSLGDNGEAPRFTIKKSPNNPIPYGALITTTIGLAVFISMSYVLPSSIYNLLISSSSFFTFFNYFIILLTFLAWRRQYKDKTISLLAFGQPLSTWLTMGIILFLTVFALFQKEQRLGFYACLVMGGLIIIGYFFSPKRKATRSS
ncbi:amino acid permease [Pullulanibacillus sp. KACC 23026]|uniref:amino acid permease n=1 Tax=Pullulanibacillus sp. KACC 23026 TaxID=3028315 RepID=UPI0023AF045F|nr:amino acid permease [Pullulanibacillus sp. KACC 23026]WEG14845.1 amino acid permease [Pullulanibacillus sp. KACC 23026]